MWADTSLLQAQRFKDDVSADVRSVTRHRQIHTQTRRLLTLVVSTCGPHCRPIITPIIKCINWTQLSDRRPSEAVRLLHHMGLDSELSRASLTEHMGSIWSQNVPAQHCNPVWGRHGHDGRVSETTSLSVCCRDFNYFIYLCLIRPFVSGSLFSSSVRSGRSISQLEAFFGTWFWLFIGTKTSDLMWWSETIIFNIYVCINIKLWADRKAWKSPGSSWVSSGKSDD